VKPQFVYIAIVCAFLYGAWECDMPHSGVDKAIDTATNFPFHNHACFNGALIGLAISAYIFWRAYKSFNAARLEGAPPQAPAEETK
jgi:hypothetical protein